MWGRNNLYHTCARGRRHPSVKQNEEARIRTRGNDLESTWDLSLMGLMSKIENEPESGLMLDERHAAEAWVVQRYGGRMPRPLNDISGPFSIRGTHRGRQNNIGTGANPIGPRRYATGVWSEHVTHNPYQSMMYNSVHERGEESGCSPNNRCQCTNRTVSTSEHEPRKRTDIFMQDEHVGMSDDSGPKDEKDMTKKSEAIQDDSFFIVQDGKQTRDDLD